MNWKKIAIGVIAGVALAGLGFYIYKKGLSGSKPKLSSEAIRRLELLAQGYII